MIDFEKYWSITYVFLANNILITLAIAVVLIIFTYKKPEAAVKFYGFCILLIAVLYIMSLMSESGSGGVYHKKDMSQKTERMLSD